MSKWKLIKTGIDGNTELFGVNIFDYKWIDTGRTITVPEIKHYKISVYKAEINGELCIFAAGEQSNCVWNFYTT